MTLNIGDTAPDFTAATDSDGTLTLSDLKGKNIVLYFYPKDNTPGCTKQAIGFQENLKAFTELNTAIIGVSKDSPKKHDNFKAKKDLTFTLISDEDLKVNEAYGVWIEKSLYGRKYMGTDRSTFIIDTKGDIQHIWRKVRVKDHIEDVLNTVKEL